MAHLDASAKPALPRPARWAGTLVGACVILAAIVGFTYFGLQTLQAAGVSGHAGHLTVTDCEGHYEGTAAGGGFSYDCRGDFVSSDRKFTAPDVKLQGDGNRHRVGHAISVQYVDGRARQTGISMTLLSLIPILLSIGVAGVGAALVATCTTWRPPPRRRIVGS
jgi:hypothetical protein